MASYFKSVTCLAAGLIACFLAGCSPLSYQLEPNIVYTAQPAQMERLPSCFPELTPQEKKTDWGIEMMIGESFARELDLYRAVTAFKRALIILPKQEYARRLQIEYNILFCYYVAGRYQDVIIYFEDHEIRDLPATFPALRELIIMLYDSYQQIDDCDKAERVMQVIKQYEPEAAEDLDLAQSILEGDLPEIECKIEQHRHSSELQSWLSDYQVEALSVRKAQVLNAVLPGAGYLYVGQRKAALTSLIINTLFTYASYQFFHRGYIAAGIITASLEWGWYAGGINGAGLAAKEYNQSLYNNYAKEAMIQQRLFPVLMFECAF